MKGSSFNMLGRGARLLRLVRQIPHLPNLIRLIWRLVRDRRVPLYLKGILGVAVAYVISPLDLIPASLLFALGLLDDLAVIMVAVNFFLKQSPDEVVEEHLKTMDPRFQEEFQRGKAA